MSDKPAATPNGAAPSVADTIYPPGQTPETPPAAAPATTEAAPAAAEPKAETLLAAAEAEEAKPEEPPFNPEGMTVPEGMTLDTEMFGKFSEIAKSSAMSQTTAQSLLDLYHSVVSTQETKNLEAWKTTREGWVTEVKADREVGGSNLDEVKRTVAKVLDNPDLTDPGFRQALEFTGIGDNPAAVRTLYRWAKALTEGTPVTGDAPSRQTPRSLAQVMYPNLNTER
jgi:hypothetical protein